MMDFLTWIAFGLLGLAMVAAVSRVIVGPSFADRILGLDVMTTIGIGAIALFGAHTGLYFYADVAIALGLIAFVATVAFARYLLIRGRVE